MVSWIADKQAELDELCRRHHVKALYLFGSATRDDFRPDESDVDFVVTFQSLPAGDLADAYFGLLNDLEVLFGRPVDLITDASIENPHFRKAVEDDRIAVYDAA